MDMFHASVSKYRRVISDAVANATRQPSGEHITFTRCFSQSDLLKVAPLLKTEAYVGMLACSHRVPADAFDPQRVDDFQTSLIGGKNTIKTDADRGEATQTRALAD